MNISQLGELLAAPSTHITAPINQQWHKVETALGFALPEDYKQLINVYGSQSFGKDIAVSIATPFSRDGTFAMDNSLFRWMESGRSNYLSMQKSFGKHAPEKLPFSAHPESNGLLAFGGTEYGGTFYWQTIGSPNEWTIVLYDEQFYEFEHYHLSLSEFLVQWLSGQLASDILETQE